MSAVIGMDADVLSFCRTKSACAPKMKHENQEQASRRRMTQLVSLLTIMHDDLIPLLRQLFDELPHPALLEAADRLEKVMSAFERIGTDASMIQCLFYGPDGDCGAVSIAERIEYECDQILQANV
jgi:hypothetical protein